MENLERAKARDARRLSKVILDPVEVRSVQDIKRVVADLDPKKNPESHDIEIAAQMEVEGDTYEVRANTKSRTKRDMLVDGIEVIKKRVEVSEKFAEAGEDVEINGIIMKPTPVGSGIEGRSWVDPLISQWTGGFRVGIHICWDLDGHRYKYNIFEHKLTRVKHDENGPPTPSTVQTAK
jgi:hypothetical protein